MVRVLGVNQDSGQVKGMSQKTKQRDEECYIELRETAELGDNYMWLGHYK